MNGVESGHTFIVQTESAEAKNWPMDNDTNKILWLISHGYLPKADTLVGNEGEPAWTLEAVAQIIGFNKHELMDLVEKHGKRFDSGIGLN